MILIFEVPSNEFPAIVLAVANLVAAAANVAVAALPDVLLVIDVGRSESVTVIPYPEIEFGLLLKSEKLMLMFAVPSNEFPAIVLAVANLVAELATVPAASVIPYPARVVGRFAKFAKGILIDVVPSNVTPAIALPVANLIAASAVPCKPNASTMPYPANDVGFNDNPVNGTWILPDPSNATPEINTPFASFCAASAVPNVGVNNVASELVVIPYAASVDGLFVRVLNEMPSPAPVTRPYLSTGIFPAVVANAVPIDFKPNVAPVLRAAEFDPLTTNVVLSADTLVVEDNAPNDDNEIAVLDIAVT